MDKKGMKVKEDMRRLDEEYMIRMEKKGSKKVN